jgi:rhodanese-related sulfurtransferase
MRRTIQRALLIVLASATMGLLANAVHPKRIPYLRPPKSLPKPEETSALDKVQALWSSGAAIFLDARPPGQYAAGHIPMAFNLPADEFDQHFQRVAPMLSQTMPIVVYCDGEECDLSHRVRERLLQLGYADVHILVNGWTVWRNAGLPTETGTAP